MPKGTSSSLQKYAETLFKTYNHTEFKIDPADIIAKINAEELADYTIYDLLPVINKGIYFLHKMYIAYNEDPTTLGYYEAHYKQLHKYKPVILNSYRTRNQLQYGFKFSPTTFISCHDPTSCLSSRQLTDLIFIPYVIDNIIGVYLVFYDHPVGILIDTPEFKSNLTPREIQLFLALNKYYRSFISSQPLLSRAEIVEARENLATLKGNNMLPPSYIPPNIMMDIDEDPATPAINKSLLVSVINKNIKYFSDIKRYRNRNDYTIPPTTVVALESIITGLKCGNKCISEKTLSSISLSPTELNGEPVIYIIYNNTQRVGCLLRDPSYINALTDKEQALVNFLFDHLAEIKEDLSLNSYLFFNGGDLSAYLAQPSEKTHQPRLKFSEAVNVQYIPLTARSVRRKGGRRTVKRSRRRDGRAKTRRIRRR